MTAKRFQWVFIKDNELELRDNGIVKRFNNERLEELLNELHEENIQYKQELDNIYLLIGRGDWSGLVDLLINDEKCKTKSVKSINKDGGEMMTEKKQRFTVKQRQGATIYSIQDYYGELPLNEGMYYKSNAEKLCKWLNEQHELLTKFHKENEQLKIRFNEERERSLKFCRNIDALTIENEQLKEEIARQKFSKKIMRANIKDYERAIKRLRKSYEEFDEMRLKRIRFLEKRLKKNGLSIYVNGCGDLE